MKKNILITGGSGFIGRNLVEGLKDKYNIFAPSHKELEIMDFNAVRKYIKKNKIKIIIHTAVKGGDKVLENILRMFFSLYNNLDIIDKLISFGSGAEYAKTRDLKKAKEDEIGKYIPEDNYGLGKMICSQLSKNNKKITTLLPFGIYGSREGYQFKFISNSIVKNLFKMPIKIKQNVIFDYLYIKDMTPVVDFFIKNSKYYGDYNITPNKSISLLEITKIINKISNYKSKIKVINKGLNFQYTGSNKRLNQTIKSLKFTNYKEGIKNLYSYYSSIFKTIDKRVIIKDDYFIKTKIKSND
jgi:GDP-L-fucose synthase